MSAITPIRYPLPRTPIRNLKDLRNSTPGMTPILCVPSCPLWFKGLSLPMSAIPVPHPLPPGFHPISPKVTQSTQELAEGRHSWPTTKYQQSSTKDLSANLLFSKTLYRSHPEALREYSVIG